VPEGKKSGVGYPGPKWSPASKEVKLLSTSNPEYSIAPDTAIHSTIYMEHSQKGGPQFFRFLILCI